MIYIIYIKYILYIFFIHIYICIYVYISILELRYKEIEKSICKKNGKRMVKKHKNLKSSHYSILT